MDSGEHDFALSLKSARTGGDAFMHEHHQDRPRTLSEGYERQRALVAALGRNVVGGKAAASTQAAMRRYGVDAPILCPILDGMVRTAGIGEEVEVRLPAYNGLLVETEVGVLLAPPPSQPKMVLVVELAHSSYAVADRVTGPDLAADLGGSFGFIFGPGLSPDEVNPHQWRTIGPSGPIPYVAEVEWPEPQRSAEEIRSFLHRSYEGLRPDMTIVCATGTLHQPFGIKTEGRFEFYCGDRRQFSLIIRD